jgi:site-specific DNA-methyltransferase (adenine-specific)
MKNRNLSHSDNWKTPPELYESLNKEFQFNFDPCPYSEGEPAFDGLQIEWRERNYINPPYSRTLKESFIKKAIEESQRGRLCVMLLPVSTSTKIFHDYILPAKPEIRFVRGRIAFHGYNTKGEWTTRNAGMHDSMLVIFDGRNATSS